MIETPRISIRDAQDKALAFMDNGLPDALHYFDEELHSFLSGSQYTFEFSSLTSHPDARFIQEGNHLSFKHEGKDYYLTIVKVSRSSSIIESLAFGLTLELTNEDKEPEKITESTFAERWSRASPDLGDLRLNINQVADQRRSWEFTGSDNFLKRLFSIAAQFDAELEFACRLNRDYSLNHFDLNVYRKHDENHQGVGRDRRDEIVRYGDSITSIERTVDISELYTSVKAYGSDGLRLTAKKGQKIYDADGSLHYECDGLAIHNVKSRQLFPSTLKASSDRYAQHFLEVSTNSVDVLWSTALRELKKISEPKITYKIGGYIEGIVGDTVTIEDASGKDPVYIQCRIIEQEVCWTDPSRSKTTFDNFTEVNSELSDAINTQMQKLVDESKAHADALALEQARREEALQQAKNYADAQVELATNQALSTVADTYLTTGDGQDIRQWTTDSINGFSDDMRQEFSAGINDLSDKTDEKLANYEKYMSFSQEGLKIGDKDTNSYTRINTDGQTIVANGQTAASFLAGGMESPRIVTKELDIGLKIIVLESGEVVVY